MRMKMPQVREYMTHSPKTISAETPLEEVDAFMRVGGFRHLPVTKNEKVVGIVSRRNAQSGLLATPGLVAADVMSPDPYVIKPETLLDDVIAVMAEEKYGSAIICDGDRVVGIFTQTDVCRALRELLEVHYML